MCVYTGWQHTNPLFRHYSVQCVVMDGPVNKEYISLANGSAVTSVPVFCRTPARIPKGETNRRFQGEWISTDE